jgi:hypothetical protein
MLFDILFVADWKQIGDYRQHQTDRSNKRENDKRVHYNYKVGMELSGFNAEPNRKELISGE